MKGWIIKHKLLSIILVVVVIAIGAAASGSGTSKNNNTKNAAAGTSALAKIGQTARDGKFEFTVGSFKCGEPEVATADGLLTKTAQGQYCLLSVSVKNIGDQAQTFDATNQYVFNSQNQKYSADSTASDYANPTDSTFLNEINPGNSATGTVVFDVPKAVTPTTAELHDSAFSGGVKVNLQ